MFECSLCHETKPKEEFNLNKGNKRGRCSYCKSCMSEYHKNRSTPEFLKERNKRLREKYQQNPEIYRERSKKFRIENKEKVRNTKKSTQNKIKTRAAKDITALLNHPNWRNKYLGCDGCFLKKYIEDQFTDGMSWERRSEIHIDHIIPFSAFDLTNEEERAKCCHYSNLQPLWARDNMQKAANIPDKEYRRNI